VASYPGSEPGGQRFGTAASFEAARAAFEAAWREYLPRRTEADFQAWRDQEAWDRAEICDVGERRAVAFADANMKCALCEDSGWVCENHPIRPWEGEHACTCGGAGAPCPQCNATNDRTSPRMPKGFKTEVDNDGRR